MECLHAVFEKLKEYPIDQQQAVIEAILTSVDTTLLKFPLSAPDTDNKQSNHTPGKELSADDMMVYTVHRLVERAGGRMPASQGLVT